ncbi:MAG: methionyl-tRNA formyltransferase [Alphaproteobacteria bacterium]
MSKLRLAFMGTPDFAVPALRALHKAGHEIVAVYSQPPKPAGRGQQIQKSPIHKAAEELGLSVFTPKTLRDADEQKKFAALKLDIAIVAAYGLILPKAILEAPRLGCINIHASLLPRWRGAAPIQRAILAGDSETGITIMQMAEGLDTGDMLMVEKIAITPKTTAGSLHDQLMQLGSSMITRAIDDLAAQKIKPIPQPEMGVTYAAKLTRSEGKIDWSKPASEIERQIRGLQPWPGCFFMLGNEAIKVLAAETVRQSGTAGTLLSDDLTIACGQEAVRLTLVQRSGKNPIDGASFLRGQRLPIGQSL